MRIDLDSATSRYLEHFVNANPVCAIPHCLVLKSCAWKLHISLDCWTISKQDLLNSFPKLSLQPVLIFTFKSPSRTKEPRSYKFHPPLSAVASWKFWHIMVIYNPSRWPLFCCSVGLHRGLQHEQSSNVSLHIFHPQLSPHSSTAWQRLLCHLGRFHTWKSGRRS